jgi:hypothetical protein
VSTATVNPEPPDQPPKEPAFSSLYGVHPGIAMEESVLRRLEEKTGRSLAEWVELAQAQGPDDERARAAWLKAEFRLGTHTAAWLAARSVGRGRRYDADALVDAMFSGPRILLRPLYEAVLGACLGMGRDVTVTPCKSAVSVRRRRVFAELLPSTRTRLDVGLALGDLAATSRLLIKPSARRDPRITHRVSLHLEEGAQPARLSEEIARDAQLNRWLRLAYERAG